MADDLISRRAVVDVLENMIFQSGKDLSKSYLLQDAKERVNRIQTAFDLEKVIEDLTCRKDSAKKDAEKLSEDGDTFSASLQHMTAMSYDTAIKVVENTGVGCTEIREVLFRGKRKDNGEWIEGYVFELQPGQYMICDQNEYDRASTFPVWEFFRSCCHEVDPKTLCQYTGLNDKNGNRIWENDILHIVEQMGNNVYHNGKLISCFCWDNKSNFKVEFTPGALMSTQRYVNSSKIECMVIGNVFDNPEIMEGE